MTSTELRSPAFRQLLKEALSEALREQRDLLHEVFAEVIEDLALAEAIRQGRETEPVSRDAVAGQGASEVGAAGRSSARNSSAAARKLIA